MKKNALGRGLGALITDGSYERKTVDEVISTGSITEMEVEKIIPNPNQPREKFDEDTLLELAESISQLGIIQPITIRKIGEDKFQIISGERRYRAAQLAGLTKVPVFIRDVNDQNLLEMALVENIQREDLNPIEIAITYERLMTECSLTQEELSGRVGKKRSTIANYVRLLDLPIIIKVGLSEQKLSMGHARALLALDDKETQLKIYEKVVNENLSVREVEDLIRNINTKETTDENSKPKNSSKSKSLGKFEFYKSNLSKHFAAKVDLTRDTSGKGKIVINFKSDDEFNRIAAIINSQILTVPETENENN